MLFDKVIAFDHLRQKLILMVNMSLDEPETSYNKAVLELRQLVELLRTGAKKQDRAGRLLGPVTPLFGREDFCRMVEQAKVHIREGDIFQIVLSNCLSAPFEGSLFNTYRVLRTLNPSPYMFYFSGADVEVAGASPETLVKLENGVLHTFPLAGTRPRGKTPEEDQVLETELLSDEKELAEHNMLVDLGRNDLGKISRFGTVQVEKFHTIERFSHVMHIGSTVRGELREDKDALDAIEAVLPAGTLSGAPKIRACQLIAELENNKRGIYGGAIGYIDFTGNMDTCIAIRIAYQKNGRVFVRSGAGIVADSVPEKEFEECMNKAQAVAEGAGACTGGGAMILLIDNYDSFSYNLYQLVGEFEPNIRVIRNDEMTAEEIRALAAGTDHPLPRPGQAGGRGNHHGGGDRTWGMRSPFWGSVWGIRPSAPPLAPPLPTPRQLMHGKQSQVRFDPDCPLFRGCPETALVGRYHSLAADTETLPECLKITARTEDGEVMAVQHRAHPVYGVQFHPESILTPDGKTMLQNFIKEM